MAMGHAARMAVRSAAARGWAMALAEPALVFLAALLVRLAGVATQPPHADDFYHFYAARSYLADGTFSIFSGTYLRAGDFTWLVAMSMRLFGETIAAARLPSLVSGALLAAAVYAWMRREAGRGPAVLAAALVVLLRPLIDLSGLVRFYAPQALLVWLGCALLYRAVVAGPPSRRTAGALVLAALALGEATRLQIVSVIGVAAWAALFLTWQARRRVPARLLALGWAAALAGGCLVLLALWQAGLLARPVALYRFSTIWAMPNRDNHLYYYHNMAANFGLLVDLLPLATVAAAVFFPRPALFCGVVLFCGLVLHSLGGMKDERYVIYLLPYLACLWGMAAWPLAAGLGRRAASLAAEQLGSRRPWPALPKVAGVLMAAFALVLAIKAVPVLEQTGRVLLRAGYHPPNFPHERSWQANAEAIRTLVRGVEVFVVDDDLQADFCVGRPDVVLNRSRFLEISPPEDFARDHRTGTRTIAREQAIRRLLACFDSGLVVSSDWYLTWLEPGAQALVLGLEPRPIGPTPLIARAWQGRQGEPRADCGETRRLLSATMTERRQALRAEAGR